MDKVRYVKEYNKNKKRKLFKILLIIMLISIILGIIYVALISKSEKTIIKKSFDQFFLSIKNSKYNSLELFLNGLILNVLTTIIIWLFSISIIGTPISIIYLVFKSFTLGFTISSLIYTYGYVGIIPTIIYIIPSIINLVVIFILMFYGINFSKRLYLYLFKGKDTNLKLRMTTYLKLLLFSVIILIVSSVISSYLTPLILKSFTKYLI